MPRRFTALGTWFALLLAFATPASALSIYLDPATRTVDLAAGSVTLVLKMDTGGQRIIGGGLDVFASGPLAFTSFTPSAFFSSLDTQPGSNADFTGYGLTQAGAGAALEIHWAAFDGFSGMQDIGSLTFGLGGPGLGHVTLADNPGFGPFVDMRGNAIAVDYGPASVAVVPAPGALGLLASALGAGVALRRRARSLAH